MEMENKTAETPVTSVPKHSVNGPYLNLNVRCELFESQSLAVAMMFHEHSSWSVSESGSFKDLDCFKHALW